MFKPLIKIISLLLIVGLNWTGLSTIGNTLAYFNDEEDSQSNAIVVATLDFRLDSVSDFSPEVTPSQGAMRTIGVINDGSLGFQYNLRAEQFSGDSDLCNALDLLVNLDGGAVEYSGDLTAFSFDAGEFIDPENWEFIASLPSDAPRSLENKSCNFKFIFEAVQLGECTGFSDVEEITNVVRTGQWPPELPKLVINKVYYDVDSEHGSEPANEWVELYNNFDSAIDIANWTIEDNISFDVISVSSLVVPAYGYVVITGSSTTWNYWNIPSGVIKIVLADGQIGNGLANDADMLALKNENGDIVDQMNWGTDPGCPDVAEGHMLGRVPNGYDTDSPSDFKDLIPPSVLSVTYSYSGTWYCGYTYTIYWSAVNNNSSGNLLIDIFYITDNDHTGTITAGDNTYLIANHINNSGSYSFYIDPCMNYCYYGYIWIKIIAYGPENFMAQNYKIGPRVFEPPAPEDLLEEIMEENCCEFSSDILEFEPEPEPEEIIEEPVAEETLPVEEPIVEEPIIEEPITEETLPEETLAEEPINEDNDVIIEETEIIEPEPVFVPEDSPVIEENTEQGSGDGEPPVPPAEETPTE